MKKTIVFLFIIALLLAPAINDASYLIRLKNGGQLVTPAYWPEGNWILFYCVGGTAGIQRSEIERIERDDTYEKMAVVMSEPIKAPPTLPNSETTQEVSKTQQAKEMTTKTEEKIDIPAYKAKKDEMTDDLNDMLEKRREAKQRGNIEATEQLTAKILGTSVKIYEMTDEVTAKNKGKLPEKWWDKEIKN